MKVTKREIEIIKLIADGKTSKGAGDNLGISKRTVEAHMNNVRMRNGLNNIKEVIKLSLQHGVLNVRKVKDYKLVKGLSKSERNKVAKEYAIKTGNPNIKLIEKTFKDGYDYHASL